MDADGPMENRLLASLPRAAYERIAPYLRRVTLHSRTVLHRAGEDIRYLYFPINCLISITVTMRDGRTAETGVVGRREVVGINAFMSGRATTQTQYVVQVEGDGIRAPVAPLREQFTRDEDFRSVMLRYTQAMFAQVTQNAACNALHSLERRLARWLLEARDRIESDDLRLTHKFIAEMLGVRRPSISELSAWFEHRGLIVRTRGRTRIVDQERLAATACECYQVARHEYDRLLSEPARSTGRR